MLRLAATRAIRRLNRSSTTARRFLPVSTSHFSDFASPALLPINNNNDSSHSSDTTANNKYNKFRFSSYSLASYSTSASAAAASNTENASSELPRLSGGEIGDAYSAIELALDSVVKIFTVSSSPNYFLPWQNKSQRENMGSGFVISGRKILTNAHVVADHTFVLVRKHGSPTKYRAEVQAVGHECDLAILIVENEEFWEDMNPLELGEIPYLQEAVAVVGYPQGALLRCFYPFRALEIYVDMLRTQVRPTSFTFPSIIKSSTFAPRINFGESIHGQIWKCGFGSHLHVQTALVDFYSHFSKVVEAKLVFDNMAERDGFAWTTMVSAYVRLGDLGSARQLFDEMPLRITASWNTLMSGFARIGDVESTKELFNKIPQKDLISWTTMINCYSQNKHYKEALEVFNEMKDNGINPDEVTMSTIISACAHLGWLDQGKEIHEYLMQNGFNVDVYIGSSLIDMYAKCGAVESAVLVFFKLQEKNLFCWNSVIEGLGAHGYAKEALMMFHMMEKEKIKPNGITFLSILTACTHAGLVDEGKSIFLQMTRDFLIPPEIKHYGCMVDLLSKAGLLEEALELIRRMNMEQNSVIWGSLLGGCKLHKNLEIAQMAVDKLTLMEPNNSGYYNILVNMYAEANRWSEVSRIRANMKNLGVEKRCPGSSWIEVQKNTFQFASCDSCHPASEEIYLLLNKLVGQLKLTSYIPEFDFIL